MKMTIYLQKTYLVFVLGLTLGLVLHGVYVNLVDGHNIGLKKNL
jgi:hypothetical protein